MPRFKVESGFGIRGLRIENYKGESNIFLSHPEICVRPRISSPSELERIPRYERVDTIHYNAAQYYYFMEFFQSLGEDASSKNISEELCRKLERGFRLGYYQKFKTDPTKIRIT